MTNAEKFETLLKKLKDKKITYNDLKKEADKMDFQLEILSANNNKEACTILTRDVCEDRASAVVEGCKEEEVALVYDLLGKKYIETVKVYDYSTGYVTNLVRG